MKRGSLVDLTDKSKRSTSQNSYLHLLLGAVALETGNELEYVKEEYYKREANRELYCRVITDRLTGREVERLRSSADLSQEEMSISIDRFKRWASEMGIYLPDPGDEMILREIERQMAQARRFL